MKAKLKTLFLLTAFSYGLMLYLALLQTAPGEPLQFHADAPIWLTLQAALSLWLTRTIDNKHRGLSSISQDNLNLLRTAMRPFALSLVLFVPLMVALQLVIDLSTQQPMLLQQYLRVGLMYVLVHCLVSGSDLFWRGFATPTSATVVTAKI